MHYCGNPKATRTDSQKNTWNGLDTLIRKRYFYRMKFTKPFVYLCILVSSALYGQPEEYGARMAQLLARQAQQAFELYEVPTQTGAAASWKKPAVVNLNEIDALLRREMKERYAGADSTVLFFVNWWYKQPEQHVRVWLGLGEKMRQLFPAEQDQWLMIAGLSQLQLIPGFSQDNIRRGIWQLHPTIALNYKLNVNDYVDERELPDKSFGAAHRYVKELSEIYGRADLALLAFFNGSPALTKAKNRAGDSANAWQLVPFLPVNSRYAYAFYCATYYVWTTRKAWAAPGFELNLRNRYEEIQLREPVSLAHVCKLTGCNEKELSLINAHYIKGLVPANHKFNVPANRLELIVAQQDSLFAWNKAQLRRDSMDFCLVYYRTKSGDFYRDLTRWFGVSMATIQEDNGLTGTKLKIGEDLFFRVPCTDSAHFATFDGLSRADKDKLAEGKPISEVVPKEQPQVAPVQPPKPKETQPKPKGEKITYVVKSGDTLWAIGQKYKVKDTDIMKWNNIGTKIQPGQKLIIYLP
jgi:LysM repeat protein